MLPLPPPRVKLTELSIGNNAASSSEGDGSPVTKQSGRALSTVEQSKLYSNMMAVVLKLLDDSWELQKKRCNLEVKARLKQKNQHLLSATESFAKYKNILISTLATGTGKTKAQNSSLTASFVNAFMFTKVEKPPSMINSPVGSPDGKKSKSISRTSATKKTSSSSEGGWFSLGTAVTGSTSGASAGNISLKPVFSLSSPPIVLFYCACLITTTPGTIYITKDNIYVQYGLPLLPQTKVIYPLASLDNCVDDEHANLPTVLLSFFDKMKVVSVTPLAVDCELLKTLIYSVVNFNKDTK